VLVVGSSGVGKSSVIKLLTGNQEIKTSDGATGCSFEYQAYDIGKWCFVDTVGLNEGTKGTVKSSEAAKKLIKFLRDNAQGFSLVVMVKKKERITTLDESNYQFFQTILCENKIPLVMVVTHCDFEEPVNRWWSDNKSEFIGTYDMKIAQAECVCSITDESLQTHNSKVVPLYKEARQESRQRLFDMFESTALNAPLRIDLGGWWVVFVRAWNWIVSKMGLNALIIVVKNAIGKALAALGLSNIEIAEIQHGEL